MNNEKLIYNGESDQFQDIIDYCESDHRFLPLLDALPQAIYLTDAEGRLTYYNEAAIDFSGHEPALGSDYWCVSWKLYHTDGTPMPHDTCPMAVALKEDRKVIGEEAIAERPDGKRIWFRSCPSPLRNKDGNIIGGINMLIDISREKKDEKLLRENERELDDFFENASVGLHWVGPDGNIKRVNKAELDLLGYSSEEYVGRPISDFHADQEVIEDILQRLKAGEKLHDYEARLRCKDGTIRHVLINSSVYEVNGEFVHTRCFTRDITEKKEAELALKENEERLSSQVSDMKRLYSLCILLLTQNDNEAALKLVMKASAELMNANKASVQVFDRQKNALRLVDTIGFDRNFTEQFRFIGINGFTTCATAFKNHEKVLVEDFDNNPEYSEFGKIASAYGMKAVLSLPLTGNNGQFFGVFSMYWNKPHSPSEDKMQLLELYTQQAARQMERNQAEVALRKSEKKYRTLFDSIDEGFCILQFKFDKNQKPVDFMYLEANAAFEKQAGLKNVVGKYASEVLPELEDHWFEIQGNVAITGEPVRFENYSNELQRWFSLYAFRTGEPQERKVAIIFNDITDRKKAQNDLEILFRKVETEKERHIEIFNNAPSLMCVMRGPDHIFERVNKLFRQLTGNRELIGKPVSEVFPEVDGQGFFELLDQVYEKGKPFTGTDMRIMLQRRPDGPIEERYLDFACQPLRDSDGAITGIFAQGVDLTEREHAKEELQAINETLEERVNERTEALLVYQDQLRSLASRLSKAEEQERQRLATELHDNLGQILAICKIRLEILHKKLPSGQKSSDLEGIADLMNEAIRYTRQLMSDLKPPPSLDTKDIRLGIEWVIKKMKKHGVVITFKDDRLPKPLSEEMRSFLLQATRELLFNVIKHSGVDKARVYLTRNNGTVQVTVKDKGRGFDVNETNLLPSENSGFGLFNISERMDLLGGSLRIISKPGKGSEVILTAPIDNEEGSVSNENESIGASEPSPELSKSEKPGRKIRILLVDDHQMMRKGLRMMIEEDDELIVIAEASDGKEAVKLAEETSPDIIIMDVDMAGMNGIEATKIITSSNNQKTSIIGLSLHDNEDVSRSMKSAGASAYVTKSEAFETLCTTIKNEAKSIL